MINANAYFIQSWEKKVDSSSGVPCGVLSPFIDKLATMPLHLPALNERAAVGIAAGMWLAGKKPLLYMQNSGMFVASNDIGSLLIPCGMDIPFIVTYRGSPGENATQHLATGAATLPLLKAFGMWQEVLSEDNAAEIFNHCSEGMKRTQKPGVILVQRGWTDDIEFVRPMSVANIIPSSLMKSHVHVMDLRKVNGKLSREGALTVIHGSVPNQVALISSTGLISRSLFARHHSNNQFYNAGAFGLTSSIGLGFAMSKPDKQVVVVEGDASCLTNFGNFATIGHNAPKNMVHVVLDNHAYGSCREEPSISASAQLSQTAALMGYKVYEVNSAEELGWAVTHALNSKKLCFIHVQIQLGGDRNFARPLSMAENAGVFKNHMQ